MSFNLDKLNMTCAPMYNAQSNNQIMGYICNSSKNIREGFESSNGAQCFTNNQCKSNHCAKNLCFNNSSKMFVNKNCYSDTDCGANHSCKSNLCADPLPPPPKTLLKTGDTCKINNECASNRCAGGGACYVNGVDTGTICSSKQPCSTGTCRYSTCVSKPQFSP